MNELIINKMGKSMHIYIDMPKSGLPEHASTWLRRRYAETLSYSCPDRKGHLIFTKACHGLSPDLKHLYSCLIQELMTKHLQRLARCKNTLKPTQWPQWPSGTAPVAKADSFGDSRINLFSHKGSLSKPLLELPVTGRSPPLAFNFTFLSPSTWKSLEVGKNLIFITNYN